MKALNLLTKEIVDVEYVDQLNENVIALTEAQCAEVHYAKEHFGRIYSDNGVIKTNTDNPKDHYWSDETNQWVFSQELKDERIERERWEMWQRIKTRMQQAQWGGVYIEEVDKWFHTDLDAQRNYFTQKMVIDYPEVPPTMWKTMDQTYVLMTPELFRKVVIAVYNKGISEFKNSEYHVQMMMMAEEPADYDFSSGWSLSYAEVTGDGNAH